MISSDRSCKRLVAGNYDVLINEPLVTLDKSVLTDYLDHFEHYENELSLHHQHHHQLQLQLQLQQNIETNNPPSTPSCGYINEFKLLKELSKSLKENKANLAEGEIEGNQRKNRYKDIIPFSHTRVILSCNPDAITAAGQHDDNHLGIGDQSQSYINANYIRGPSGSPRAYIACQGPLPCTLNDFWRMIWECSVSVIVMACNENESGKPKCELYWPEQINGSQTYGNYRVTLMRVRQINSDFLIRKFTVQLLAPATAKQQHRPTMDGNINSNNNNSSTNKINCTNNMLTSDNNQHKPPVNDDINYLTHKFDQSSGTAAAAAAATTTTTIATTTLSLAETNHLNRSNDYYFSNGNSSTSNESISTSDDSSSAKHKTNKHQQARQLAHAYQQLQQADEDRPVLLERTICQFHYTTWPDHGVPDSVHPILELVRLIREVQPAEDKPVLVHCSAGCGRTGTICCIDYVWGLIRMGKLDASFNLCNIISEMRQQRMAMVQTLEQYILCHRAVAALFMQQLQLISLDNNHNHRLEKCNALENNTSSSVEDSAIEDNERDELDEDDDESHGRGGADEYEQELGPVFI